MATHSSILAWRIPGTEAPHFGCDPGSSAKVDPDPSLARQLSLAASLPWPFPRSPHHPFCPKARNRGHNSGLLPQPQSAGRAPGPPLAQRVESGLRGGRWLPVRERVFAERSRWR